VYGNAADHPDRVRRYPSDMTDAEWTAIRPLLPVPAWLQGRGGQPEGYCHRQNDLLPLGPNGAGKTTPHWNVQQVSLLT
jgi:hypothetical protein